MALPESGRNRVVIEGVKPEIDGGRFPIKRTIGEQVVVEADLFADGHDALQGVLLYRRAESSTWTEIPLEPLVNDRWRAAFPVTSVGRYRYTLLGWMAPFLTWRLDLKKRVAAGQDVSVDLLIGAALIEDAVARAEESRRIGFQPARENSQGGGRQAAPTGRLEAHPTWEEDRAALVEWARRLRDPEARRNARKISEDEELVRLMDRYAPRRFATMYEPELEVVVDRERARYSAWYEMFPRSCAAEPGTHGTFSDCEARLPYIAAMGFDVLYLPPIHPVGRAFRKGPNNVPTAGPGDTGSPWGIGAEEGGHKSIHPELGTLNDFRRLVANAKEQGLEIALDVAFQCSPDHPYVKEHPEWFVRRPDGTIQYAENPPKKYQDIYPFYFECDEWQALWNELKSVFVFWIEQGVHIFRVDNPHTKPFPFWEWAIGEIKRDYPDIIFLSEAFTRPKIMYRLAKLGFTQSYTYFSWRNTKQELTEYFTELTQTEVREFFRPNLWPNTPDILTEYLQLGGRPAFMARLVLAATLGASYGIYGPAFELCYNQPREPGSEEYLNSEKYQIVHYELDRPDSLKDFIGWVNRIRRENPALHSNETLRFHRVDNEELICYSKHSADLSNVVLVVVNLDPHHTQSGWVDLQLDLLKLEEEHPFQVHDLLTGARYLWHGRRNYVELNPHHSPAHIFHVRRRTRMEQDFEYFM